MFVNCSIHASGIVHTDNVCTRKHGHPQNQGTDMYKLCMYQYMQSVQFMYYLCMSKNKNMYQLYLHQDMFHVHCTDYMYQDMYVHQLYNVCISTRKCSMYILHVPTIFTRNGSGYSSNWNFEFLNTCRVHMHCFSDLPP